MDFQLFTEDQLLPISALQHLIFCERQCALIHLERLWAENHFTVEGNQLHQRAHGEGDEKGRPRIENGIRVERGIFVRSSELGIWGQTDVVEFHPPKSPADSGNVIPIEYKRGKPKKNDSDRVQICAQALCLEERLGVAIPKGYLFYGKRKRRTDVEFTDGLRDLTLTTIRRLHEMIASRVTPTAVRQPKCESCSLIELCMPGCMQRRRGVESFTARQIAISLDADGPLSDDFERDDIQ